MPPSSGSMDGNMLRFPNVLMARGGLGYHITNSRIGQLGRNVGVAAAVGCCCCCCKHNHTSAVKRGNARGTYAQVPAQLRWRLMYLPRGSDNAGARSMAISFHGVSRGFWKMPEDLIGDQPQGGADLRAQGQIDLQYYLSGQPRIHGTT